MGSFAPSLSACWLRIHCSIAFRVLAAALLAAFLPACSTPPKVKIWVEALEQEIRQKEDQIYELEDENDRLCKEVERLKRKTGEATDAADGKSESTPIRERPSILVPKREEKKRSSESMPMPSDVNPPAVEGLTPMPKETPAKELPRGENNSDPLPRDPLSAENPKPKPAKTVPDRLELPDSPVPNDIPKTPRPKPAEIPEGELPSPKSGSKRSDAEPIDPKVSHLRINPAQTGGYHSEGRSDDEGLRVAIETRNQHDQFVAQPGPLTVVAIDPELPAESQKIGRWKLSADQVAEALALSAPEPGMLLHLPWADAPPQHSHLKLFVRYLSPEGQRCETQHDVYVTLPGQISDRWTPSSGPIKLASREAPVVASKDAIAEKPAEKPTAPRGPSESETTAAPGTSPAPPLALPATDHRPTWRPYR